MSPALKSFLQRWLINTVGVLIAAHIVRGIRYDTILGLLIASLLLGALNAFVRPFLLLLSLPLLIFSLGLFTLVINAFLLYLVGWMVDSFHVATFGSAFWGSLIISVVSLVANSLTGAGKSRIRYQRQRGSPPSPGKPDDDGQGPIIDV